MPKEISYELVYLISGKQEEDKVRSYIQQQEKSIAEFAKDIAIAEPKKIRLAYPILKEQEAFLVAVSFVALPESAKQFQKALKKEKDILRFLMIKKPTSLMKKNQAAPKKESVVVPAKTKTTLTPQTPATEKTDSKESLEKIEQDLEKILENPNVI